MRYSTQLLLALVVLAAGCIPPPSSTSKAPSPASPASTTNAATSDTDAANQPTERIAAVAGVGKKGQSLEGETGMIVEPVKQLIRFEQKSVFDLQIKPALELYKATNGAYPKSHDEFMTHIIKANGIQLPELPAGQTYVFDAEQGQLMVERPQQ